MTDQRDPFDPANVLDFGRIRLELQIARVDALEQIRDYMDSHGVELPLFEFIETELNDARQLLAALEAES